MAVRTDNPSASVVEGPGQWDSQLEFVDSQVVVGRHPVVELESGTLVEEAGPGREGSLEAVDRTCYVVVAQRRSKLI